MSDMDTIVCECVGVTKGDIVEAVKAGADTFEKIGVETTAGSVCGTCQDDIEAIIAEVNGK